MSDEKTRKIDTLAKLFQAMRSSRSICWIDYRTTCWSYNTTMA